MAVDVTNEQAVVVAGEERRIEVVLSIVVRPPDGGRYTLMMEIGL